MSSSTFLYLKNTIQLFIFVIGFFKRTWYKETVKECTIVWTIWTNRQDSFRKNFLDFRLSINELPFAEYRSVSKFRENGIAWNWPIKPKVGSSLIFTERQTCFSQKIVAAFHSSRYHPTLLLPVKVYGKVNCCTWFLAKQIWYAESAYNCISIWNNLIFIFEFFKATRCFVQNKVLFNNCNFIPSFKHSVLGNVS